MKLSMFNGLAHDLAAHLDEQFWYGYYKDYDRDFVSNVLDEKNSFDKGCVQFFLQRLPESFDFSRIKSLLVTVHGMGSKLNIKVEVVVDDKNFSYSHKSMKS